MTGPDETRETSAWKRRSSRAILLLGVGAAAAMVLPSLPHEQQVVFRLDGDHEDVRRIDASWTRAGEHEPIGGVTLRFAKQAPPSVRHALSVPDGDYVLAIDVERAETSEPDRGTLAHASPAPGAVELTSTHYVRTVHLQGGETTIPIPQEP